MRGAKSLLVVLMSCPTRRQAVTLAKALVARRLAACVNVIPNCRSWFWWDGKVQRASEVLLLVKTSQRCFPRLQRLVPTLHPYDVPEILALPVAQGHPPYVQWLLDSLSAS